jgi:hemin uptake protein HemP
MGVSSCIDRKPIVTASTRLLREAYVSILRIVRICYTFGMPNLPSSPPPERSGATPEAAAAGVAEAVPAIKSEALFRGAVELRIEHHGSLYRLRQTALGKLILTK